MNHEHSYTCYMYTGTCPEYISKHSIENSQEDTRSRFSDQKKVYSKKFKKYVWIQMSEVCQEYEHKKCETSKYPYMGGCQCKCHLKIRNEGKRIWSNFDNLDYL